SLRQLPAALDSAKAFLLALSVFVTYGLLHWSLLLVLVLAVPLGMVLYWKESRAG
ncbi:MAG: chromate transporter, partial [Meiothermus sp.]